MGSSASANGLETSTRDEPGPRGPRCLRSGAKLNRTHFHHLPGYVRSSGELQSTTFSSLRDGRWKLYYDYTNASFELYDLVADIGETTDLAAARPGLVNQLGRRLVDWLPATDAPLATLRVGQAARIVDGFTGRAYAAGTVTEHEGDTNGQPGPAGPGPAPPAVAVTRRAPDAAASGAVPVPRRRAQGERTSVPEVTRTACRAALGAGAS